MSVQQLSSSLQKLPWDFSLFTEQCYPTSRFHLPLPNAVVRRGRGGTVQLLLFPWQRRLNRRAYLLHPSAVILPCWLECRNDSIQLVNICASSPHPPKSGRLLHADSSIFSDNNILIAFLLLVLINPNAVSAFMSSSRGNEILFKILERNCLNRGLGLWWVFFKTIFFSLLFAEEKPPTAFIHPLSSASLFTRAEL